MNRIEINGESRSLARVDDRWVMQQILRRERDGVPVCVTVVFDCGDTHICFSTCPSPGTRCREWSRRELELIALWERLGCDSHKPGLAERIIQFLHKAGELVPC